GFLRSESSLIQTMGRAARNANSQVIMFADTVTKQMQAAIDETQRRRVKQLAYNKDHGITARTIEKAIRRGIEAQLKGRDTARAAVGLAAKKEQHDREELMRILEAEMLGAAKRLEFEKAAVIRDQIAALRSTVDEDSSGGVEKPVVPEATPGMAGSKKGITGRRRRGAAY
ncbi:MAG: UvrB/UvrC motif-containing protein, partial [Kiloniellales bacterium]